jgi:hypothetical protein
MRQLAYMALLGGLMALGGCMDRGEDFFDGNRPDFVSAFSLDRGKQGWTGGFSNYMLDAEDTLQLFFGRTRAPSFVFNSDSLTTVSGICNNADLFSFITFKVMGLEGDRRYLLEFEVEFIAENRSQVNPSNTTNETTLSFMKVGAVPFQPEVTLTPDATALGYIGYQLNLDKGIGSNNGQDLITLGGVALPPPRTSTGFIVANNNGNVIQSRTNDAGEMWLVIGFDSQVPVHQAYHFRRIIVYYTASGQ